jgi:hypothetical protein
MHRVEDFFPFHPFDCIAQDGKASQSRVSYCDRYFPLVKEISQLVLFGERLPVGTRDENNDSDRNQ